MYFYLSYRCFLHVSVAPGWHWLYGSPCRANYAPFCREIWARAGKIIVTLGVYRWLPVNKR